MTHLELLMQNFEFQSLLSMHEHSLFSLPSGLNKSVGIMWGKEIANGGGDGANMSPIVERVLLA